MPGRDRTGPLGEGPATGGGFGYCVGTPVTQAYGFGGGFGRGWGRGAAWVGRGMGRGWRNRFYATGSPAWAASPVAPTPAPEQEVDSLKAQAEALKGQLEAIQKRIDEIAAK